MLKNFYKKENGEYPYGVEVIQYQTFTGTIDPSEIRSSLDRECEDVKSTIQHAINSFDTSRIKKLDYKKDIYCHFHITKDGFIVIGHGNILFKNKKDMLYLVMITGEE